MDTLPFAKSDLIVMTTHAHSGLSRLLAGSVATEGVRRATMPVVLIVDSQNREKEASAPASARPVVVALVGRERLKPLLNRR